MIALSRSKTALTVIPRRRKGRDRSQTKGYRMSANRASGQQMTKRISHKRNLTIREPPRIPVILRPRATFPISQGSIIYTKERTRKYDVA
jgi:carbamoylphosphate synthase large subunit